MMISIVVPVAREGADLYDRIRWLHNELLRLSKVYDFSYEIVLVSDVLHAATLLAMVKLARNGIARSLLITSRLGKGGSIKNAVPYTRGEYIVLLDADLPVSPKTVLWAVLLAAKTGSRIIIANRIDRNHSLKRRLLSVAYNLLVNLFFGTGIRDHQAGFKVFERSAAVLVLLNRTRTDGYAFDTEAIVWARKHGLRYRVINVIWREKRSGSTIPPFRALLTMLADLIVLRLLLISNKYTALRRITRGRVIDLRDMRPLGHGYVTVINVSGRKRYLFSLLRRLYVAVAFGGKKQT